MKTRIGLIQTFHPTLRDLLHFSSERGWVSFEELNTALPDEYLRPDKMGELLVATSHLGINFINHLDRKLSKGPHFYAPLQTNLRFKRDNPRRTYNLATEEEILAQEAQEDAEAAENAVALADEALAVADDKNAEAEAIEGMVEEEVAERVAGEASEDEDSSGDEDAAESGADSETEEVTS